MSPPVAPAALGPRSLLATLAVFAGLTLLVVTASTLASAPATPTRPPTTAIRPPDPDALAFLGPLATHDPFDGWTIDRVDGRRAGALPLVLRGPDGLRLAVELRPLDPRSPPSPAASATLAIYVPDTMPPGALAGVLALARALRSREQTGGHLAGLEPLVLTR